MLAELADRNGRVSLPGHPPSAAAAAADRAVFADRTMHAFSRIDLGAEIVVKIDRGGLAANLFYTESCRFRNCKKVILPSPIATPMLVVCAGHHEVERPLRVIGADYAPLLRGISHLVFSELKTKHALWQHAVRIFPAAPGLFEVILRVLGMRRDQAREGDTNATFVRHFVEIYDADLIAMLLAFQRFDSSSAHIGNGLIKRYSATATIHMVIAPLTVHVETRRSDGTSTLTLRVCSSIRTCAQPPSWVLAPNFHVPVERLELQRAFSRSIAAVFDAMSQRQRGEFGHDRDYAAVLDEHALVADECVALQTELAAEHKAAEAVRRRDERAAANAGAARPPPRARAAAAGASRPAQGETVAQARNRFLAESGVRRDKYLRGNETRDELEKRSAARLRHLEAAGEDTGSDIPLLFMQQALEQLEELDLNEMDV